MRKVKICLYGTHLSTKEYDLDNENDLKIIKQIENIYGKENIKYENKWIKTSITSKLCRYNT